MKIKMAKFHWQSRILGIYYDWMIACSYWNRTNILFFFRYFEMFLSRMATVFILEEWEWWMVLRVLFQFWQEGKERCFCSSLMTFDVIYGIHRWQKFLEIRNISLPFFFSRSSVRVQARNNHHYLHHVKKMNKTLKECKHLS